MQPYYEHHPASARFFSSECGVFPAHLHSHAELLYVFRGEVTMVIDGCEYTVAAGNMALCFPGVVHSFARSKNAQGVIIVFLPDVSMEFSSVFSHQLPVCPVLQHPAIAPDAVTCMRAILDECRHGGDERVQRAYLQVVLARTIPQLTLIDQPVESPNIAYRILQYLSQHFTEPISLSDLSRELGVSESHLSHTFSQRFQTSFRAYINTLRLDRACTLLSTTDDSITRILYECGFESPRTFNRVFTKQYGITPSEYRSSRRNP